MQRRSTAQQDSYTFLQGIMYNFTIALRNYHCGTAQGNNGLEFVGMTAENRKKYIEMRRQLFNGILEFDRANGLEDEL